MILPAVFYGCETSSFTVRGFDNTVGHVARKEEIRNAYAIWWEIPTISLDLDKERSLCLTCPNPFRVTLLNASLKMSERT
jgi:hypothetical protein